MILPIEIIIIFNHYKVEEGEHFSEIIDGVVFWFKIIRFELYISSDRVHWQPSPNVLFEYIYGNK